MRSQQEVEALTAQFRQDLLRLEAEINKVIVGQDLLVRGVLIGMFCEGNVLLEGTPGLGKTQLVKTISDTMNLKFGRIQFTPDLMPADILGTNVIVEQEDGRKEYELLEGPIFANILMADEINRAIPKTQAALLEAMQERSVTIFRKSHKLSRPFLVLATQNPIEMEGTYPLPEAKLDRFLFKLNVQRPDRQAMHRILELTTGVKAPKAESVITTERILEMQSLVREVEIDHLRRDYVVRLVEATHPESTSAPDIVKRYVRFGSSPRGAQAILLSSKVRCLAEGRFSVSSEDIRYVAKPALRHRMILSFEGEAEGITSDQILDGLFQAIPEVEK